MTSLGFSEYTESNNDNTKNGNSKIYNRRAGGSNRTLKIPRNTNIAPERGLLQSPNGAISGIPNDSDSGKNDGVIQEAGKKIKQIKDYIENIHRKGGEDSDDDGDSDNLLPSYPSQGMGVYSSNVTHSGIVRGGSSNPSSGVVHKTTQMNSLNPGVSYSSTLLEGMQPSTETYAPSPYFEKLTGIAEAPKKDAAEKPKAQPFSGTNDKTSTYASQYYEQFVPYAESLAGQLAHGGSSTGGGTAISGTNAALIEKLNYIIHMLEQKKDEKTGHVIEELVLYCFLGVFIIFIVDTFTRASGGVRGAGANGGFSMFGGGSRRAQTAVYRR